MSIYNEVFLIIFAPIVALMILTVIISYSKEPPDEWKEGG